MGNSGNKQVRKLAAELAMAKKRGELRYLVVHGQVEGTSPRVTSTEYDQ